MYVEATRRLQKPMCCYTAIVEHNLIFVLWVLGGLGTRDVGGAQEIILSMSESKVNPDGKKTQVCHPTGP